VMTRTYVWNVYCMIIDNDIGTVINVVDLYWRKLGVSRPIPGDMYWRLNK
jgi:hypothetical protein